MMLVGCWYTVIWWWEFVLLLGLSRYPRHYVVSFIQASIPVSLFWYRWCVMNHLAALSVNLTRHVVICPLQIPTLLTFVLVTSKLGPLLWQLPPWQKPSPMHELCWGFHLWSDCICFLSLFLRCSSLRKMTWDKNITWNRELAWQIGNFDC